MITAPATSTPVPSASVDTGGQTYSDGAPPSASPANTTQHGDHRSQSADVAPRCDHSVIHRLTVISFIIYASWSSKMAVHWRHCGHWLPIQSRVNFKLACFVFSSLSSPIVVRECHQDARSGVHLVSPGLLQLTAVQHQRRTTSTPAVGAERCHPPGHRRPSV